MLARLHDHKHLAWCESNCTLLRQATCHLSFVGRPPLYCQGSSDVSLVAHFQKPTYALDSKVGRIHAPNAHAHRVACMHRLADAVSSQCLIVGYLASNLHRARSLGTCHGQPMRRKSWPAALWTPTSRITSWTPCGPGACRSRTLRLFLHVGPHVIQLHPNSSLNHPNIKPHIHPSTASPNHAPTDPLT